MEYRESSEKDGAKEENLSYNDALDLIFKDINDFSHHDPTITYNDPLLDISNNQVGNKSSKANNNFEPFLEPSKNVTFKSETSKEGPFKSEDNTTSSSFANDIETSGENINNDNASKLSFIKAEALDPSDKSLKDDSSDSNFETIEGNISAPVKANFKTVPERISATATAKRKSNENVCVECGEDCEDWIQLLAHVCKKEHQEKIKPLKKKSNHRSVIVITDDVDENGKAIEFKVRLQDVNNNANGKDNNNVGQNKNRIDPAMNKEKVKEELVGNNPIVKEEFVDNKANVNGEFVANNANVKAEIVAKKPNVKGELADNNRNVNTELNANKAHVNREVYSNKNFVNIAENFYQVGSTEQPEYPCNECDRVFKRVCNLTQHKKATHCPGIQYSCNQCGQNFKSNKLLLIHVNQIHESHDYFQPLKLASKAQFLNQTERLEFNGLKKSESMATWGNCLPPNQPIPASVSMSGYVRVPANQDGYARVAAPATLGGYSRVSATQNGYAQVPSPQDVYAQVPSTPNGCVQVPSTQNSYSQVPSTQNGYSQVPSTQNGYAQVPSTQNGYGQVPSTQNGYGQVPPAQNGYGRVTSIQNSYGQVAPAQNGYAQVFSTQNGYGQVPSTQNGYGQVPSAQNGYGQVPSTQNGYGQIPSTQVGYTRVSATQHSYARVPTTQNGYARVPSNQDRSQNRPRASSKKTKDQLERNHAQQKIAPASGIKYSPEGVLGNFLQNSSCEGVGPHLHVEGESADGIPILQSCRAQSSAQSPLTPFAQSFGYLDAKKPQSSKSKTAAGSPNPLYASLNVNHATIASYAQSTRSQTSSYPPLTPYTQSFKAENVGQHSPDSAGWPVWVTQKASVRNSHRSAIGPRKGPWSVNGSLPYLRISLSLSCD